MASQNDFVLLAVVASNDMMLLEAEEVAAQMKH